jgi:hypothetical protein
VWWLLACPGRTEGTTDKGERVRVIELGHLTALDDPQVRTVAAKYGDTDKLLIETWFPAVLGINSPALM